MADDDAALHERLARALHAGTIELEFHLMTLAQPGSPVSRTSELALLIAILLAMASTPAVISGLGYSAGVIAGLGLVAYFWVRWYMQRIKQRVVRRGLESESEWDRIWRHGGVVLKIREGVAPETCVAPVGDWRAFVRRHVLHQL